MKFFTPTSPHKIQTNFFVKNYPLQKLNHSSLVLKKKNLLFKNKELESSLREKTITETRKYINLLFRNGLKIKMKKIVGHAFNTLFFLLKNKEKLLKNKQVSEKNFLIFVNNYQNNFFCINTTLESLIKPIEPIFTLKCENIPKKKKKKNKDKFTLRLAFLKKKKRKTIVLRWFYLNTLQQSSHKITNMITTTFLNLLTDGEDSLLFRRKLQTYKKALTQLKSIK